MPANPASVPGRITVNSTTLPGDRGGTLQLSPHSRWVAGPVRRDQVIGPDGTRSGRYQAGKSVMGHRVPPDPSDGGGPAPNQGRWESIVGDFPPAMGDP